MKVAPIWPRTYGGPFGKEATAEYPGAFLMFHRLCSIAEPTRGEQIARDYFPSAPQVHWEDEATSFTIIDIAELKHAMFVTEFKNDR